MSTAREESLGQLKLFPLRLLMSTDGTYSSQMPNQRMLYGLFEMPILWQHIQFLCISLAASIARNLSRLLFQVVSSSI